jgi:hypothetical protein
MKIDEKQFKDEINKMANEAWEKMGYPGTPGWDARATDDEKHYCGRYRALEDVLDLLEKK